MACESEKLFVVSQSNSLHPSNVSCVFVPFYIYFLCGLPVLRRGVELWAHPSLFLSLCWALMSCMAYHLPYAPQEKKKEKVPVFNMQQLGSQMGN